MTVPSDDVLIHASAEYEPVPVGTPLALATTRALLVDVLPVPPLASPVNPPLTCCASELYAPSVQFPEESVATAPDVSPRRKYMFGTSEATTPAYPEVGATTQ